MNTRQPTYWQIAAGSESRDYSRDFLKYGIAFVGGEKQIETMRQVNEGDIVILKNGMSLIVAAGKVVVRNGKHNGDAVIDDDLSKHWLRDYDGWNLPAYCYVDWHVPSDPVSVSGLTRSTIQRVGIVELRNEADKIIAKSNRHEVETEPVVAEELHDYEMLRFLIEKGLRPAAADELTETIRRIRLLADYYYEGKGFGWRDVREHETRTFLIVPFLLALGWSEQQMKIELAVTGGRVDIACFSRPYRRENSECVLLLESKGFSQGLDYAHGQGKNYAKDLPNCRVVIATNGYCYKAYCRKPDSKGFNEQASAYLNLLRPTKKYALDPNVGGGLELLSHLLPNNS